MDKIKLKINLKITSDGENILGPGIIELLRLIDQKHSLRSAAKAMAMSYSKAWRILNHAEVHWGFQLTEKKIGGEHGGESSLTSLARDLICRYEQLDRETRASAEVLFEKYFKINICDLKENPNAKS